MRFGASSNDTSETTRNDREASGSPKGHGGSDAEATAVISGLSSGSALRVPGRDLDTPERPQEAPAAAPNRAVMAAEPISPELALVDPDLRLAALAAWAAEDELRPAESPAPLRLAPARPLPAAAPRRPLPVAAAAYAALVFGRMVLAGVVLALLLVLLVGITLVLK